MSYLPSIHSLMLGVYPHLAPLQYYTYLCAGIVIYFPFIRSQMLTIPPHLAPLHYYTYLCAGYNNIPPLYTLPNAKHTSPSCIPSNTLHICVRGMIIYFPLIHSLMLSIHPHLALLQHFTYLCARYKNIPPLYTFPNAKHTSPSCTPPTLCIFACGV